MSTDPEIPADQPKQADSLKPAEKSTSLTSVYHAGTSVVFSPRYNLPEAYIENTGLNTVLSKRDIYNFRPIIKASIALTSEELFQIKMKRKMLLRKESELDYQLQDSVLQEEYRRRSTDMNNIIVPADNEQAAEIARLKQGRLFQEMMEITYKRNQLLQDLDIERLREEEEDKEILEECHRLKLVWQNLRDTHSPIATAATLSRNQQPNGQHEPKHKADSDAEEKERRISRRLSHRDTSAGRKRKFGKLSCVII